jgi:ribonuclease D
LSEGFSRSSRARDIVEAVKRGLKRDPRTLPPLREGTGLPADRQATVELLRVLLKACAARSKVAPRLIADAEHLERLASEDEPDIPALKGWRYELFGAEAQRLKRGELALRIESGEVVPLAVKPAAATASGEG